MAKSNNAAPTASGPGTPNALAARLNGSADAARERRFDDNALIHALTAGRSGVSRVTDSAGMPGLLSW